MRLSKSHVPGIFVVLWIGLTFGLVSCQSGNKANQAKKATDSKEQKIAEAVPVEVTRLGRGDLESTLRATANLVAEESVIVPARTTNRVLKILVEEGDQVEKNQILLHLENDAQKTALERAQIQLDKSKREFKRKKSLHDQNLISTQEFNDATANLEELALAFRDKQRELDYTQVRAPINGTITQRMISFGDQINMNQNLFEIVDFNSIVARIFVPEKHLPYLRENLRARISSTALADKTYAGYVRRIAPTIDAQTGTVKVTIGLDRIGMLRPGLFVDVQLILEVRETVLLIPKKALVYDDSDMYVFSLQPDMRVIRKQVIPRLSDRTNVEPVSGFSDDEQIVIAGQAGLKEGAKVQLPNTEKETEPIVEETTVSPATKPAKD